MEFEKKKKKKTGEPMMVSKCFKIVMLQKKDFKDLKG